MNKMVWTKQKVTGVMISNFLIILITLSSINLFSQENIKGKYSKTYSLMEFHTTYEFNENGLFEYRAYQEGHLNNYGKGHYSLNKKNLILNYDLTKSKPLNYHKLKFYENNKDSITLKVKLYDMNTYKPLSGLLVTNFDKKKHIKSNNIGEVFFQHKKNNQTINLLIGGEEMEDYFLKDYFFSVKTHLNYEINVYLKKYPSNMKGTPIKNSIYSYKIKKITNEYIKLRTDKKKNIILKKVKE